MLKKNNAISYMYNTYKLLMVFSALFLLNIDVRFSVVITMFLLNIYLNNRQKSIRYGDAEYDSVFDVGIDFFKYGSLTILIYANSIAIVIGFSYIASQL